MIFRDPGKRQVQRAPHQLFLHITNVAQHILNPYPPHIYTPNHITLRDIRHTSCTLTRHVHMYQMHAYQAQPYTTHIYNKHSTTYVHTEYIYTRHTPYSHTYKTYNTCIHSTHRHTMVSSSDVNWVCLVSVVQQNRVPAL